MVGHRIACRAQDYAGWAPQTFHQTQGGSKMSTPMLSLRRPRVTVVNRKVESAIEFGA